ncbi:hypothetical protein BHE74_00007707 [Ensete ventricosum]|nr:hypothetical protein BHE74_00007707 [Ensete ventricosum]
MGMTQRSVMTYKIKSKTSFDKDICVAMSATNPHPPTSQGFIISSKGPIEKQINIIIGGLAFNGDSSSARKAYARIAVNEYFEAREEAMIKYMAKARRLINQFRSCTIVKVPQAENSQADALA